MRTTRGQATLEFTLVFIIATALLLGLLGLWKWSSDNIIKRQIDYNKTADRVARGTRESPSSPSPRPPEITVEDAENFLDFLKGGSDYFSILSLDQINTNLEDVNKAVSDIQKNLPTLVGLRDSWRDSFNFAEQQEAASQQQIASLSAQKASLEQEKLNPQIIGYDPETGQPVYKDYDGQINALNQEIAKTQNGYYTQQREECTMDGCYTVTTYDYSNGPWMSKFGSREKWAEDYWVFSHYGVSEGNNKYGLYANYTPGQLDWQARKTYAQPQKDNYEDNLTKAETALAGLQDMQGKLQAAKDSKEK